MLTENETKKVLEALTDAGLCVCDESIIGTGHPAVCADHEYVIGRVEESGGFDSYEHDRSVIGPCTDGIEGLGAREDRGLQKLLDKDDKCPKCEIKWQYLSGQKYCPCESDHYYPDPYG